jgi:hypothetical protein
LGYGAGPVFFRPAHRNIRNVRVQDLAGKEWGRKA